MKKDLLQKIAIALLSAFVIVYCFVQMISSYSERLEYSQAIPTSYEEKRDLVGYILRNERLIENTIPGYAYTPVEEGAKIKKGQLLATVYANAGETNIQQRILEIDSKIEILSNSQIDTSFITSDVSKLDNEIYDLIYDTRNNVQSNSLNSATKNRGDLLTSLNRRQIIIKAVSGFEQPINQLKAEKAALESTLSGELGNVFSPAAGYFSMNVDGWETQFTTEALKNMTVESFEKLIQGVPVSTDQFIGKICLDYDWYTLCPVDKIDAVDYTVGQKYSLEFPSTTNRVFTVTLDRMITQTDSETVVLVFRSDEITDDFKFIRKQNVKIVLKHIEGLRINKEALRIVNGEQGVYVLLGNNIHFRKAEIIYTSDDYYLIKRLKSTDPDYRSSLMLYDNVVIGGKDLYDGKIVN